MLYSCAPSPFGANTAIPETQAVTPINTPSFTAENMAYISELEIKIPAWLKAYTKFNSLHQKANDKKKIFLNENWKNEMSIALDELSAASDDLISTQPVPSDMQNINNSLNQTVDETRLMIEAYRVLIKDDNRTLLDQIYAHSENALQFMKSATDEIQPYLK